jgi:SPP1 gp7 family putative phage head morphogenesis protein
MTCQHQHAHLAELSDDPTNTEGIREAFIKEVRRRFRRVRGAVREAVGYEDDVLHLSDDARLADADDVERFASDEGKTAAFMAWVVEKVRTEVLEPMSPRAVQNGEHWTATYIRSAYARGWENARARLRNEGVAVEEAEDIFRLGVPQRQLRRLYTRAFENLASYPDSGSLEPVRETLTQGLAEGVNPKEMARRLTKQVRSFQRTHAEVLARTEIINSYAEATLDRYERAGVDGVTVSGEFATADDSRVCPICDSIEGAEFAADEMRTATFTFDPSSDPDAVPSDGGTYPVKPPVHPRCRCTILPVV